MSSAFDNPTPPPTREQAALNSQATYKGGPNMTGAQNNHGYPPSGNGVGGSAGTHENHVGMIPPGDDNSGHGAF